MTKKSKKKSKQENNRFEANNTNKPQSNVKTSEFNDLKKVNEQANSIIVNKISDNEEKRISKSKEIKETRVNVDKPTLKKLEKTFYFPIKFKPAINKVARQVKSLRDLQGKPIKSFDNIKFKIQSFNQQISPLKGALGIAEQVEYNAKLGITKQSDLISEQHKQLLNFTKISAIQANSIIVNKISDNEEKRISKSKEIKETRVNVDKPTLKKLEKTFYFPIKFKPAINKVARQVKSLRDLQGKPIKSFDNIKFKIQSFNQQISPLKGALGIAEQVEYNAKLGITKQSDLISEQHKQLLNFTKISAIQANSIIVNKISDNEEKRISKSKEIKETRVNVDKPTLKKLEKTFYFPIKFKPAINKVARQVKSLRDLQGKPIKSFDNIKFKIQSFNQQISPLKGALGIAEQVEYNAKLGITKQSDLISEQHKQLLNFTKISTISANTFGLPVKKSATNLSEITNPFKIPIENIETLTDTINYLSDNTDANAANIIRKLKSMVDIADKLNFKKVMALNSAFLNLNIKTDGVIADTYAIDKSLSTKTQSNHFQKTLQSLEFDAIGIIQKIQIPIKQQNTTQQTQIHRDLFSTKQTQNVNKLTNNLPLLNQQQTIIKSPNANGSLQLKADIKGKSFASQYQLLKASLTNISNSIGGSIQGLIVSAMPLLTNLTVSTRQLINNHPTFAATFIEIISITSIISTALSALGKIPTKIFISTLNRLETVITTDSRAYLLNSIGIVATTTLVIRKNCELFSAFFSGFCERLTNEIRPLRDTFSFLGPIFTTTSDAIGRVINWFSELLALIKLFKTIVEVVSNVWDLIKSLPDKIAAISSKIKELLTGENGLLSIFTIFGSDIVNMLTNSMKNRCNDLKDNILKFGNDVSSWFKSELVVNSPSNVFKKFGINVIEDYQLWIDRTQGGVLDSMSKFSDKVTINAPYMPLNTMNNRTTPIDNSGISNIQEGTSQYYITINAAPGMNEQELARVITQELDRREQQQLFQIRSSLRDIY